MNRHLAAFALVLVLAGCSNRSGQVTAPAPAMLDSKEAPGLPPLEHSGPSRIRVWTDDGSFRAQQEEGVFNLQPESIFHLAIPEGQALTLNWSAQPAGQTNGFRWSVDMEDITDETPRINDEDVGHWSSWSTSETSATVRPFSAGTHWVYIESRTKTGFISLFPLQLEVTP
jgi:hypothetical protein